MRITLAGMTTPAEVIVVELPRLGQPRTTMITITSLRFLHRLVVFNVLVSVVSLTVLIWRL